MPTSSFGKVYTLTEKEAERFLEEMAKDVPPTLPKDFKSHFVHAKDIDEKLRKALGYKEAK